MTYTLLIIFRFSLLSIASYLSQCPVVAQNYESEIDLICSFPFPLPFEFRRANNFCLSLCCHLPHFCGIVFQSLHFPSLCCRGILEFHFYKVDDWPDICIMVKLRKLLSSLSKQLAEQKLKPKTANLSANISDCLLALLADSCGFIQVFRNAVVYQCLYRMRYMPKRGL